MVTLTLVNGQKVSFIPGPGLVALDAGDDGSVLVFPSGPLAVTELIDEVVARVDADVRGVIPYHAVPSPWDLPHIITC